MKFKQTKAWLDVDEKFSSIRNYIDDVFPQNKSIFFRRFCYYLWAISGLFLLVTGLLSQNVEGYYIFIFALFGIILTAVLWALPYIACRKYISRDVLRDLLQTPHTFQEAVAPYRDLARKAISNHKQIFFFFGLFYFTLSIATESGGPTAFFSMVVFFHIAFILSLIAASPFWFADAIIWYLAIYKKSVWPVYLFGFPVMLIGASLPVIFFFWAVVRFVVYLTHYNSQINGLSIFIGIILVACGSAFLGYLFFRFLVTAAGRIYEKCEAEVRK